VTNKLHVSENCRLINIIAYNFKKLEPKFIIFGTLDAEGPSF